MAVTWMCIYPSTRRLSRENTSRKKEKKIASWTCVQNAEHMRVVVALFQFVCVISEPLRHISINAPGLALLQLSAREVGFTFLPTWTYGRRKLWVVET